jgi:hypothetical protein
MDQVAEAASPASNSGDGVSESGNLSLSQAAAILFANEQKGSAKASEPTQATPAEEVAPSQETTAGTAEQNAATPSEQVAAAPEAEAPKAEATDAEAAQKREVLSKAEQEKQARIQEKVQKRVNEEIAKRKEMEDRIANLESALKQAQQPKAADEKPVPKGKGPLADVNDLDTLATRMRHAKEAKRWAQGHLNRGDIGEGVQLGDRLLSREDLVNVVQEADVTIEDQIPQREKFLLGRAESIKQAHGLFPFLNDPKSEDFKIAQQAYQANPWLQDLPNADFIVGVQVEGLKAIKMKQEIREKMRAEAASKNTKPSTAAPAAKPGLSPKPVSAVKPAGDQTAVSSNTTAARVPTQSVAKRALESDRQKLSTRGAVTASEAAALLQRSDQLRNTR